MECRRSPAHWQAANSERESAVQVGVPQGDPSRLRPGCPGLLDRAATASASWSDKQSSRLVRHVHVHSGGLVAVRLPVPVYLSHTCNVSRTLHAFLCPGSRAFDSTLAGVHSGHDAAEPSPFKLDVPVCHDGTTWGESPSNNLKPLQLRRCRQHHQESVVNCLHQLLGFEKRLERHDLPCAG
jgi:hypothetical protein